ncbi:hypothetical protein P7C70_g4963, partial [Phenoliferia sp. Uapishka_3]
MLAPSVLILLLAFATSNVNAHGKLLAITGANGATANGLAIDPSVPNTGSTKAIEADTTIFGAKTSRNPAAASGCGKTPGGGTTDCASAAAKSLATSGGVVPTANSDGTVDLTFHQVNQDGAGPLTAMVSGDMGATWQEATVKQNVNGFIGLSGTKNEDIPVKVQVPAGTSCGGTAGSTSGVCLVALANPIAGFGGSAPFAMAGAAPPAAASPAAANVAGKKRQIPSEVTDLLPSELTLSLITQPTSSRLARSTSAVLSWCANLPSSYLSTSLILTSIKSLPPSTLRRILREIHSLTTSPPEGVRLCEEGGIDDDGEGDMSNVRAWVEGPTGTPFQGQSGFDLLWSAFEDYASRARLMTSIHATPRIRPSEFGPSPPTSTATILTTSKTTEADSSAAKPSPTIPLHPSTFSNTASASPSETKPASPGKKRSGGSVGIEGVISGEPPALGAVVVKKVAGGAKKRGLKRL